MNTQILEQNLGLLVGQDQVKQLLTKSLLAGNCSAYLLVGPPHIGKGFLSRIMAASLHQEINVFRVHPDTIAFDDILQKNLDEDGEKQWKDSVVEFIHLIYLSPVSSSVKIGIIENIDRFSVKAMNALLKTLEEPPARAMLILTAQEISNVLPTIISRTQMVRLHYLSDVEIEQYVKNYTTEQVSEIVMLTNGAVGTASQLINQPKLLAKALAGLSNFQALMHKDIFSMIQMSNIKDRDEAITLLQLWLNLTRRTLISKLGGETNNLLTELLPKYSVADLIKLIDRLKLAISAIEANANIRVTLESTALSVV